MEISIKTAAIATVLLLGIGYLSGKYTTPAKVVTKIEEKIVEKEVVKTKVDTSVREKKNREYIIVETTSPDGTIRRERRFIDKGETTTDTSKVNVSTTERDTELKSSTETVNSKNLWNVSALATMSHTDSDFLRGNISYGAHVQRQILGPISVGAFGLTNKTYGLSLGVSF
jgi:uncharacterized protein YchJ